MLQPGTNKSDFQQSTNRYSISKWFMDNWPYARRQNNLAPLFMSRQFVTLDVFIVLSYASVCRRGQPALTQLSNMLQYYWQDWMCKVNYHNFPKSWDTKKSLKNFLSQYMYLRTLKTFFQKCPNILGEVSKSSLLTCCAN